MKKVKYYENEQETVIDLNDYEDLKTKGIKITNHSKYDNLGQKSWKNKLMAILPLLITAIYLFLGFQYNLWHPYWVLFFLIPLASTILYSKKVLSMGTISFLVTGTYFLLGLIWHLWHPAWLIFFLIPILAILIGDVRGKY